jgi:ubiquinone/menaquinone biosynthesis C-methylase UbiE
MKSISNVGLANVQAVYSGAEGDLWELVMGQQIHIGGFQSSMDLAEKAGLGAGMRGVDLCCCSGAGMRFLVRFHKVDSMRGVDATAKMVERGRQRCQAEGLDKQITLTLADVCASGLPSASVDFVWGEDAWCYVVDKPKLIAEAARLVKPSGLIAFTDWMEGSVPMTAEEASRCLTFMKFPSVLTLAEYSALLEANGCAVRVALDTGRFPKYVPLYLDMIERQLTYDALKIIGFDTVLAGAIIQEMRFLQTLAEAGKIIQGQIIAQKTT